MAFGEKNVHGRLTMAVRVIDKDVWGKLQLNKKHVIVVRTSSSSHSWQISACFLIVV
jgi:hypothetical protein